MTKKINWKSVFADFNSKNILVIGDVMIDSYVVGQVNRISPEAPVPVVSVSERYNRLGGAANVALNIKSLGANPILCSAIGNDGKSDEFMDLMELRNLSTEGILKSKNRLTTTKFRVIGNNTQMLRVDEEDDTNLNAQDFILFSGRINHILNNIHIDAIVFEDYDKGIIDSRLIDFVTKKAKAKNIPLLADPKKKNFKEYYGLTLFKPNLKELNEGVDMSIRNGEIESIIDIAKEVMQKYHHKALMVTLSEYGVLAINAQGSHHIPAEVRNIADVSGAGDTVISTVSLAMTVGLDLFSAISLANLAGGLVCESIGVVPIDKDILFNEVLNTEF